MVTKTKRKIAVVTGTRAEYGLLYWLMREIQDDPALELQLVATGMHLSPEFGLTYRLIEQDGFQLNSKVEMLLSSDSAIGITKSMGLGLLGFADTLAQLAPDLIVILGDRFEALVAAQAALIQKIPVAHIHGGELSEGAIDDAIRHSITKMSHLHFVAANQYRQRVIQLGEHPNRVFNVGAPGLERISRMKLLSQQELEEKINFSFGELNFIVTYHPATLDIQKHAADLDNLFEALNHFPSARIIFTKANADENGRLINAKIDEYVLQQSHRAKAFISMGDLNYLSALQYVDVVIGNSSSGLIETPYFKKPTVNIGNRQQNRLRAASVIDCNNSSDDIYAAIHRSLTAEFKQNIHDIKMPYGLDNTANKIKSILKEVDLNAILVKRFYDLPVKEVETV